MNASQVPQGCRRRRLREMLGGLRARRIEADEAAAQLHGWTLRRRGSTVVVRDPRFDKLTPAEVDRIADCIAARRWL